MSRDDAYRRLPAVGTLLDSDGGRALLDRHPRALVLSALRQVLEENRTEIARGAEPADAPTVLAGAAGRLAAWARPGIRRVINASGVILHTGLGRAVLAAEAVEALGRHAATYCTLAMNMRDGGRAHRERFVSEMLCQLTGAEAATVVNNNAAATLLTLRATSAGKEAIVSRGQLVEIGGSYRLPDVMDESGATMVEVGTTNKTHPADYERAINENTGLLVRVHTSNYKIMGFASEVSIEDMVAIGRKHGIPVFDDLGAGALVDLRTLGFPEEPVIADSIRAGVDVLTCSADKLIGASQGGIVLGRAEIVGAIRRHPMFRSVRVGKLDLIALEATLRLFLDPDALARRHPTLRMMTLALDEIEPRARRLRDAIDAQTPATVEVTLEDGVSRVGSGSLPVHDLPTKLVGIRDPERDAGEISRRLRERVLPVVSRVQRERVHLDPRTLQEGDDDDLIAACVEVLAS